MQITDAAALLRNVSSVSDTAPLLRALGFSEPVALDSDFRRRIALPDQIIAASAASGTGAMRALVCTIGPGDIRDGASTIARRLSETTPHLLWLIFVLDPTRRRIVCAVFHHTRTSLRVCALHVDQQAVVPSDAETLCALAASSSATDLLTHTRWCEILGRESIGRRFFLELTRSIGALADSNASTGSVSAARDLALVYLSRLLFLSFLQAKGLLDRDHDFLARTFDEAMETGGSYHRRVLLPLFFGTLNTQPRNRSARARSFGRIPFLNGGLFTRTAAERSHRNSYFSDDAFGHVFDNVLTTYRFTPREESVDWSETAIDPEILGHAFESLMAAGERKRTGAFYTPRILVQEVMHGALRAYLESGASHESVSALMLGQAIPPGERAQLRKALSEVRILDPACGSGAFLVYALEHIAVLHARLGDDRPPHTVRQQVLTTNLFGVDVNPMAVWLCELRLWLAMTIGTPAGDPARVPPLPNLDHNIRAGDSLRGESFGVPAVPRAAELGTLRRRYARASGRKKRTLGRALERAERACAVESAARELERWTARRRELIVALRSRDLFGARGRSAHGTAALRDARIKVRETGKALSALRGGGALPFSYRTHFADVAAYGGFDIVVGNPPWVRIHNIPAGDRMSFAASFVTFRQAGWRAGAATASAGGGFASQVDISALFLERSVDLAREGGAVALLLPAKLWRSLAGGALRAYVTQKTQLVALHDLSESRAAFGGAAVYPSIIALRKAGARGTVVAASSGSCAKRTVQAVVHRGHNRIEWTLDSARLALDDSEGSPWILVPPPVRKAFERIRQSGMPLGHGTLGRPLLGVKTGCNAAFLVHDDDATAVEPHLLRPVIRGEDIRPWTVAASGTRIIWALDARGRALATLPPGAQRWFTSWRADLQRRTDCKPGQSLWEVYRTESAACDKPRIVWADIGTTPAAAVLARGNPAVPLNTCYVLRCRTDEDANAVAALLNSPLAAAWLNVIAEPARGGYHRYLGWTVALLPLPANWTRARAVLSCVGAAAAAGAPPAASELLDAVLAAYCLRRRDVEPLLMWNTRS